MCYHAIVIEYLCLRGRVKIPTGGKRLVGSGLKSANAKAPGVSCAIDSPVATKR